MKTYEERVELLHTRMAMRKQRKEKRTIRHLYMSCITLAVCLVLMIFGGGSHPGGTAHVYTGAAMLFTGAGPFVLTAVVAFMLGVIITVLLKWKQEKKRMEVKGR